MFEYLNISNRCVIFIKQIYIYNLAIIPNNKIIVFILYNKTINFVTWVLIFY